MPMSTSENIDAKLIEFLALVAGLLGVVVAVSPSTLNLEGVPLNMAFVVFLVAFMFYSALAYISVLRKNRGDSTDYTKAAIAYFSGLMAYALASNATTTAIQIDGRFDLWYVFFFAFFVFFGVFFNVLILQAFRAKSDDS